VWFVLNAAEPPSCHPLDQFALVTYTTCCCLLQSGPMEGLTGNWLFHNFSAQYFDAERPITPFEIIPRVRTGAVACRDVSAHLPYIHPFAHSSIRSFVHLFIHWHCLLPGLRAHIGMCIRYVYQCPLPVTVMTLYCCQYKPVQLYMILPVKCSCIWKLGC